MQPKLCARHDLTWQIFDYISSMQKVSVWLAKFVFILVFGSVFVFVPVFVFISVFVFVFAEYSWPNFHSSVWVWHAELAEPSSHKLLNLEPSLAFKQRKPSHKMKNEENLLFWSVCLNNERQAMINVFWLLGPKRAFCVQEFWDLEFHIFGMPHFWNHSLFIMRYEKTFPTLVFPIEPCNQWKIAKTWPITLSFKEKIQFHTFKELDQ